ncbi:MAG TPA: cytochrome c biogenesis protein CcmE, partial [Alphaproteobacteria bacterium]|nr:cytochrome c biogenesis protein CcmE [Alphaproteobacteria bacterium]
MTRKKRRLYTLIGAMVLLSAATALVIGAFRDNLVFFFSPTEVAEKGIEVGQRIRMGGLVEEDSVIRDADGLTVHFRLTDLSHTIMVTYR